jgi:hypothetical protein
MQAMNQAIAAVLESMRKSEMEDARTRLGVLMAQAKTEREKGSTMAAAGLLASISKGKEGGMQTWGEEKMTRAAQSIKKSQMADDWDLGYADTLLGYARLMKKGGK